MFEKILVCLDGSNLAEQIIPYARQEAQRFCSQVHLLHIVEKPHIVTTPQKPEFVIEEPGLQSEKFEAAAYLENISASLHINGLNVSCTILEGTVGESILTYAQQYGIGLIAMATHGRSGLRRAVFGSVADFVLRKSEFPILLVRSQELYQLKEVLPIKKILVCLDGSKHAEQIIPYAAEQALCFDGKITLLRVIPEPIVISPNFPGTAGVPVWTPGIGKTLKQEKEEAKAYLEVMARELLREKKLHAECVTVQGPAGNAIINYTDNHEIDLITIATHGHSSLERAVFGSVADYVLRESGLPIMLIRPKEKES